MAEKAGQYSFIDASWSTEFLQELLLNEPAFKDALQNSYNGFPQRLTGPLHRVNFVMNSILTNVQHLDFSAAGATDLFLDLMKKYFLSILKESGNQEPVKREMKEADWQQINNAKQLIDAHPEKHFTIPEISVRIGLNEFKLKKLFPMVTGFKVDEYRKYQLCIKAGKKVIQMPDEPLKNFYTDAGYTSLTTFVRGFRKLCCCTPGELRNDQWDLSGLTNNLFTEPEKNEENE